MARLIEGKSLADEKMTELAGRVKRMSETNGLVPSLKLLQVGDVEESSIYARAKIKRGKKIGADVSLEKLPSDTTEKELREAIEKYGKDPEINGIMVETPLPGSMNFFSIVESIPYYKDVDGMTPFNHGRISLNNEFLNPATPSSVATLIEREKVNTGEMVTIINRSPIVGKPLSHMLLNRNFTVNVCHSKTVDLREVSRRSKVVVVAVGREKFLDRSFVTENSIVIDVGINYSDNGITGDADFDDLKDYVEAITPVPGGVGPLTATYIFENLVKATEFQLANFRK